MVSLCVLAARLSLLIEKEHGIFQLFFHCLSLWLVGVRCVYFRAMLGAYVYLSDGLGCVCV